MYDYADLLLRVNTMECTIKSLRQQVKEFESGERYLKLQKEYHCVIVGYEKHIKKLRTELEKAHAETSRMFHIWYDQCAQDWETYLKKIERLQAELEKYKDKYWESLRASDEKCEAMRRDYEAKLAVKDAVISEQEATIVALGRELEHKTALLERNSTNTSIPTSQTPINQKKHIPNTRRSTGKSKGGQIGHTKHILEKVSEDEITNTVPHPFEEGRCCPKCGSDILISTGTYEERDEIDIEVKVTKTRHKYEKFKCECCGKTVCAKIPSKHWADCQYGPHIQALALSLINTTNVAINKVPMLLEGMTKGEVCPSEAYIAKLQERASRNLQPFIGDVSSSLIKEPFIYWDDTVAMQNTNRGCIRFYGTEYISYFTAHEKKDLDGILEDGILSALPPSAKAMHDHNIVNYNKQFCFQNIECNAHLQRDLQKSADDTGHTVLLSIKDLITQTIHNRNELIKQGVAKFDDREIRSFNNKLDELLREAENDALNNGSKYTGPFERALVARIKKYRKNYFAWVEDFTIPTTNNLSERALRGIKSKLKISGQFSSVETAGHYADIRSYIDTCRKNGINEMEALSLLCEEKPYTAQEIFGG